MIDRDSDRNVLRVGVVLPHGPVPGWLADLIAELRSSPDLDVLSVARSPDEGVMRDRPTGIDHPAVRAFLAFDRLLFHRQTLRFAAVSPPTLPAAERVEIALCFAGARVAADGDGEQWRLDGVPLALTADDPAWANVVADTLAGRPTARLTLAFVRGDQATESAGVCPAHPVSPHATAAELATAAAALITERLRRRAEGVPAPPSDRAAAREGDASRHPPVRRRPGVASLLQHVARTAGRKAVEAAAPERWGVMVGREEDEGSLAPSFAALKPLAAPIGAFWADPFIAVEAGQRYLFVEECVDALHKAHIAVAPLAPDGSVGQSQPVLSAAHHLSYPHVLAHGGRWYMTPEQSAARNVTLYECERFPDRWHPCAVLLDDVAAVDPTVAYHGDRWWLFACVKHEPSMGLAYDLRLFFADELSGPWRAHPGNPLLLDVSRARPAGALFRIGERLFRPSQDGSGGYGRAVVINEVVTMTPELYEERPVARIDARGERGIVGTHHLCRQAGMVAVDAARRRRRRPRRNEATGGSRTS